VPFANFEGTRTLSPFAAFTVPPRVLVFSHWNPTPINIQRPRTKPLHVVRYGPVKRLAGHDDGFVGGSSGLFSALLVCISVSTCLRTETTLGVISRKAFTAIFAGVPFSPVLKVALTATKRFRMSLVFLPSSFKFLSALLTFKPNPCAVITAWMVGSCVIGNNNDFKVFNAVVRLVSVFVVNMLPFFKLSSKMLFHNVAMFKHVKTVSGELNVTISSFNSPDLSHEAARHS